MIKNDYISREDAIKKVEEHILPDWRGKVRIIMNDIPSADVVERKAYEMSVDVLKSEIQDLCECLECITKALKKRRTY